MGATNERPKGGQRGDGKEETEERRKEKKPEVGSGTTPALGTRRVRSGLALPAHSTIPYIPRTVQKIHYLYTNSPFPPPPATTTTNSYVYK